MSGIPFLKKLLSFFLVAEETPLVAAAETDNDRDHRKLLQLEGLFEIIALLRPFIKSYSSKNLIGLIVRKID